jgi:tetraacyldisaccharide 4'-kinase
VCITESRNFFYRTGILKPSSFSTPVICIGNLSVGGTGKSPMVNYLAAHLKSQYQIAVLSRGYGRKTRDYLEVETDMSADTCGDEPLQCKRKNPDILVSVDGNRVRGIVFQLGDHPNTDLVLLDDAFQHRAVKAGLNILLTEFSYPFFQDHVLPTGNLRELRKNARRANLVVVTKCPTGLSDAQRNDYRAQIKKYTDADVFFASIQYTEIHPLRTELTALSSVKGKKIILVTGIANPAPLEDYLKQQGAEIHPMFFADHYRFKEKDIQQIQSKWKEIGQDVILMTTEKDAMRLGSLTGVSKTILDTLPMYYQSIGITIENEEKFNLHIHEFIRTNQGDSSVS